MPTRMFASRLSIVVTRGVLMMFAAAMLVPLAFAYFGGDAALYAYDEAIVVTNPEVSAVRDADRVIGLAEASEKPSPKLIINRLRPAMVKRGEMKATLARIISLLRVKEAA